MSKVKRYVLSLNTESNSPELVESENGDIVMAEDYDKLMKYADHKATCEIFLPKSNLVKKWECTCKLEELL